MYTGETIETMPIDAAYDAVDDEVGEADADRAANRGDAEEDGREQHRRLAPEPVAQPTSHSDAANGSYEGAADIPALCNRVKVKTTRNCRNRAGYDSRVIPEQYAAKCGNE